MTLQDEEVPPPNGGETEPPVDETPPPNGGETEPPVEHDAVSVGGKCSVCDWEFGSTEPHEVSTTENIAVPIEGTVAPPEPPPPPEPSPDACPAIPLQATCPKCGWSIDNPDPEVRAKPHATL